MSTMHAPLLILVLILTTRLSSCYDNEQHVLLRMPDVSPHQEDLYLCTAFPVKSNLEYLIQLEAKPTSNVHHVLMFGCKVPGIPFNESTPKLVWNCPENLSGATAVPNYTTASACAPDQGSVMYAWAVGAPRSLRLPEGVAYRLGQETDINYLVLQAHYIKVDAFSDGSTDDSGVDVTTIPGTSSAITKSAGIMLVMTEGSIPSHSITSMEAACEMVQDMRIHPFAYRTHTHGLGRSVTAWKVDKGKEWTLIGRKDPQLPQAFYPINDTDLTVGQGEIVAVRCLMDNDRDHVVNVGDAVTDEMCRLYMMYYVDGTETLDNYSCTSPGPPEYYWATDPRIGAPPDDVDRQASLPA